MNYNFEFEVATICLVTDLLYGKTARHKRLSIGNKLKHNIGHVTSVKKAQFQVDSILNSKIKSTWKWRCTQNNETKSETKLRS